VEGSRGGGWRKRGHPADGAWIRGQLLVCGDQQEAIGFCLSKKKAVEWISMQRWEIGNSQHMVGGNREFLPATLKQCAAQEGRLHVEVCPVEPLLDHQFPEAGHAEQWRMAWILQHFCETVWESLR